MNPIIADKIKDKNKWTILSLLNWSTEYLKSKNIQESRLTSELLLSKILNKDRVYLYSKFDQPLIEGELNNFKTFLLRAIENEPIQYIIGETEFYATKIKCRKNALIPRPETELLVEKSIFYCNKRFNEKKEIKILEIGTGSGCISIALKKIIKNSTIEAIDISNDAIELAKENAVLNSVDLNFANHDILKNDLIEKYDIIISNPPYISQKEYLELQESIIKYEPRNSLTDESDGLTFYKLFSMKLKNNLNDNGICIFEHAFNQKEGVSKIFSCWNILESFYDYNKLPRGIVVAK